MSLRTRALVVVLAGAVLAACRSHDASQVIRKDPATVYGAFTDAWTEGSFGGASQFGPGWNGAFQIIVDKTRNEKMDVTVLFNKETASEVHFTFTPQSEGKETLVTADVDVDQSVMAKAFAGTENERVAQIPDFAFSVGMQRLLTQSAGRIEAGMPLGKSTESWMAEQMAPPELPEDVAAMRRRHEELERQEAAAKPMLDPNDAAKRYMGGSAD